MLKLRTKVVSLGLDHPLVISRYGYGSIPINTILMGWTSIYQLFWCELQGYKVLTHCHIPRQSMMSMAASTLLWPTLQYLAVYFWAPPDFSTQGFCQKAHHVEYQIPPRSPQATGWNNIYWDFCVWLFFWLEVYYTIICIEMYRISIVLLPSDSRITRLAKPPDQICFQHFSRGPGDCNQWSQAWPSRAHGESALFWMLPWYRGTHPGWGAVWKTLP